MCAPATEGQFGEDISMAAIREALKKIGFTDMIEVGLGGDMTAAYEAAEWSEAMKEGKKMTTSCCPAFINMMRKHFENGWMWEGDKNTGVLELKDEKGDVVERIEHALLTDIKTVQEKVEAMCCATV